MRRSLVCAFTLLVIAGSASGAVTTESWDWVTQCRLYHLRFSDTEGVVCHFGDSITYSNPYSQWIRGGAGRTTSDNAIRTWMFTNQGDTGEHRTPTNFTDILTDWSNDGWYLAYQDNSLGGGSYTARSSIRSDQYLNGTYDLPTVENMLDNYKPEIVVLMLGTNDASANRTTSAFKTDMEEILKHIIYLDGNPSNEYRGTVPIISTIPPKRDDMTDVANYNTAILQLAEQYKLPIIDFCGEILLRRPTTWDGTLISGTDGVHPTASQGGYTATSDPYASGGVALSNSGYLLRCFLSVQRIKAVWNEIVDHTPGTLAVDTTSLPDGFLQSAYSETLAASGGYEPYTWSVTVGSLPPGLSLDTATGEISGTPTTELTNYNFTVEVEDSDYPTTDTDTQALSIYVWGVDTDGDLDPDATDPDDDNDGLDDSDEIAGPDGWDPTDPLDADSDDDGHNDGAEVSAGTDPNDDTSFPVGGGGGGGCSAGGTGAGGTWTVVLLASFAFAAAVARKVRRAD